MSSGYRHFAGLKGSKQLWVGADETAYVYTDVESAVDAAQSGDVVHIEPGTWSLTQELDISKSITIIGHGRCVINGGTAGIADRLVMLNKPASGTAATYMKFENIEFVNAYAADVIEIDNDGGSTGALYVDFVDCGFDAEATGLSLDVDQTTNTIDLFVRASSRLGLRKAMEGCNFALTKAASEVVIEGYDFGASVIALGAADVASIYSLINCQYESAAMTTGGAASIIFNAQGCAKVAGGAISAVLVGDFDATAASENLQAGALAV